MNAATLEQKIVGSQVLYSIAKSLGKAFLPYVQRTMPIILDHIDYKYSKEIRRNCIKTIHCLSLACGDETSLVQVITHFFPKLLNEIKIFIGASNGKHKNLESNSLIDLLF
jgi:hypothetical protein